MTRETQKQSQREKTALRRKIAAILSRIPPDHRPVAYDVSPEKAPFWPPR